MEKKPWYRSKIFVLGVVMGMVGVTDLATGWLSGQGVTSDQINVIQTALPAASENIKDAIAAKNYFGIITAAGGFLTAIWRKWFTNTTITF